MPDFRDRISRMIRIAITPAAQKAPRLVGLRGAKSTPLWEETGAGWVLQARPTRRRDGGHTANKKTGTRKSPRAVGAGGAGRLPNAQVGNHISRMIRIAITPAAYAAIAATLALGTGVAVEPERAMQKNR